MQDQLAALFGSLGGAPPSAGADGPGVDGMPDMSRLFAQMMDMPPPNGAGHLLGDMDDPAGLGGPRPGMPGMPGMSGMPGMDGMDGGLPPGMAEMFNNLQSGAGFPGLGGVKTQTKSERWFPLVHALSMILLGLFCVVWWEPSLRAARWAGRIDGWWARRWGGLIGQRGWLGSVTHEMLGGVEVLVSGSRNHLSPRPLYLPSPPLPIPGRGEVAWVLTQNPSRSSGHLPLSN